MQKSQLPIGIFDSGLGGLTVVRQIIKQLPYEDILYFGDLARLPYGIKSQNQIIKFSRDNAEFLMRLGIKALVIGCNSSASAIGFGFKQSFHFPVIDVIEPAVRKAAVSTQNQKIGIIGTQATIESGAYEKKIRTFDRQIKTFVKACPLFVPMVEEGRFRDKVAREAIKGYLSFFKKSGIDTLILGCTHYPLLKSSIQKFMGKKIKIIDSAEPTTFLLKDILLKHRLQKTGSTRGVLRLYLSDQPRHFLRLGERFLGQKLRFVESVQMKERSNERRWETCQI